ncbi:TIGR03619 family F420-dependent LLM class oxidoreductase [Lentzea jiangxiensis]|uniref:Probable F420-dependent oxidoreductase, Rv2161c family n=1 Tax=Lentzea jiangxiensis TaxID=641025 RepID=A0A1H0WZH0_9PSEU|nr:TIGR03619 family F420-dependent LLM class oxidoreductase [Lentzea jiangxiensis]SDP95835.1 probable F420-dependent oxidoreductase, Rv2161c family [Lentzea jiangxiensis]
MRFGVNIPNYGDRAAPGEILRWAQHAEQLGYHLAMVSDHVALTPDVERLFPAPFYDPFATLSWLAGQTSRIELGTTVIVLPYRHPLLMARMAAAVDQFSGGRLVLGVAAGWAPGEFAAVGADYRSRGRIADESLRAMKALWNNDIAKFDGSFVRFGPVATGPRPMRSIPIWVGGHSTGAVRRAVVHGDAWHPTSVPPGYLEQIGMPQLRRVAEQQQRPVPALAPRIKLRITSRPLRDRDRILGEGTVDQLRGDLVALADLGATEVVLDTTYPGETVRKPAEHYLGLLELVASEIVDLGTGGLR